MSGAGSGRGGRFLLPLAIGALAFTIRALQAPAVFLETHVQLRDPDAYYHMRRILFTLVNFPQSLGVDPYLAPPRGGQAIWPPLFDTSVAWLLRPIWTPGGELAVERAAAWLPPLLGALAAVAVLLVGRRIFDAAVGAVAGLLVATLPIHAHYSQVGFVDHHAAVALVAILLIAAAASLLRELLAPPVHRARLLAAASACGILLGVSLLLWPGSLIHVAAVVTSLLLFAATRRSREEAVRASLGAALAYGVAFLLVAPSGLGASSPQWSDWTPVVLSHFQPWLYAALAGHALGCGLLWRSAGAGAHVPGRLLSSLALGLAALGLSILLLPGLSEGLGDALRWLSQDEAFQAMVAESRPLLQLGGHFSVAPPRQLFGDLVYAFPFFLGWLAWTSRRRADRDVIALLVIWAVLISLATLMQRRFANSAALPFALVTAWALVAMGRLVSDRAAKGSRGVAALVTTGVLAAGTASLVPAYASGVAELARFVRSDGPRTRDPGRLGGMVALGEWLRANTPPTRGFFDADAQPEYSVLAMWGHGHVIRYVGRRPPVVDNFGDDVSSENFAASVRYFGTHDEAQGLAILDRVGARYVVVDPINVRIFAQSGARSLSHRLYRFDGSGLGQHRLIHDLAGETPGAPPGTVPYKIFERVAGARIRGRAEPGERVSARLGFTTNRGRQGELEWTADTAADGTWEIIVPHATASRSDVATGASYRVEAASGTARVRVSERDVEQGGIVDVPPPTAPPAGSPP